MYGTLDISTSGLIAQRVRLTSISGNIANRSTLVNASGELEPYRARRVVFAPGDPSARTRDGKTLGVHVAQIELDQSPFNLTYDPGNALAYKRGPYKDHVPSPNVNVVVEQMNAFDAARAYEANIAAAETTKTMMNQALRLLA
ncbi:MAG: flagellar basal body rod protein FlgC [Planctomycetota bacterium]|nr:flagellar basal body rod protein FlgC [Planctomycetota bacterium]